MEARDDSFTMVHFAAARGDTESAVGLANGRRFRCLVWNADVSAARRAAVRPQKAYDSGEYSQSLPSGDLGLIVESDPVLLSMRQ